MDSKFERTKFGSVLIWLFGKFIGIQGWNPKSESLRAYECSYMHNGYKHA